MEFKNRQHWMKKRRFQLTEYILDRLFCAKDRYNKDVYEQDHRFHDMRCDILRALPRDPYSLMLGWMSFQHFTLKSIKHLILNT